MFSVLYTIREKQREELRKTITAYKVDTAYKVESAGLVTNGIRKLQLLPIDLLEAIIVAAGIIIGVHSLKVSYNWLLSRFFAKLNNIDYVRKHSMLIVIL